MYAVGIFLHFQRAIECLGAMIRLLHRRGKDHGDGIADNAIQRAFMLEGDGDHFIQIVVEQPDGFGRVEFFPSGW